MPKVPEVNNQPLSIIYNPQDPDALATLKQKDYILTLCQRRNLPLPDVKHMTKGEAAKMISNLVNVKH